MPDHTLNRGRAILARDTVMHHGFRNGAGAAPLSEQITRLLANLRHLCDAEGLSFRQLDNDARELFAAEHTPSTEPTEA